MAVDRLGEGGGSSQVGPKGIVPTCFWHGCDAGAEAIERIAVIPPGSRVARNVNAPLCHRHRVEWRRTGRVNLFTHPDNLLNQ